MKKKKGRGKPETVFLFFFYPSLVHKLFTRRPIDIGIHWWYTAFSTRG